MVGCNVASLLRHGFVQVLLLLFVFGNYSRVVSDKLDAVSGYRVCEMEVYRKLAKALKLYVSSFVRKSGSMLRG